MKTSYIFLITSIFLLFSCGSYDHLYSVQYGYWYACPDATNKQLIDNVMSNANWEAIVGEDGKNYVNVKGISNGGETEGKEIFFQFSSDELNEAFDFYAFGVDENNDGVYSDSEWLEMYSEDIVANLCAEYGLSYDGDASFEEADEGGAEVEAPEGTISVVDYQIDFSEGAKVEVYGALVSMSLDLIFLYQFPEMMPAIEVDISSLNKEQKRKIMGCGDGCEVTISGEMKSIEEIKALSLSSISEIDPSKLYQ